LQNTGRDQGKTEQRLIQLLKTVAPVTGRFAPTPTGPLHFGSLITAIASYCDVHSRGGRWLVRLEDTDIPRIQEGSEAAILAALSAFALCSDDPIVRQQDRLAHYQHALDHLAAQGLVYGCACTRKTLTGQTPYQGTCRDRGLPLLGHAVRLRVPDHLITFEDGLQGPQQDNLHHSTGDFVLRRRDGIVSYQLAVVVDDALQGVTDVMRGADLLDNTARQIWLGQCLAAPPLRYAHLPLALNHSGQKLSKQNLDPQRSEALIRQALVALGQDDVGFGSASMLLNRAVDQWSLDRVPRRSTLHGVYA
jgi:glutamyl-Q tRNA(Asp) synthetase